ncbi:CPBP family intramembrane glutamic endopeptidase [Nitrospirillum iridis]|uniref:Membrane protease YdiL (CAAX protease family) n=1 Tax=Nitrospirillum iridis TaxID=765888 RepID=A0A7X0B0X0_9PROT|nr:CPBP family intramembrane glutamic endopeptidase [Nitrospirillum iridis]MBB6253744.1 membrane protease YdiL (CAAX protease family) [Nitrospirillum iridis]
MFDYALTALLVLVLPAYQICRSLTRRNIDEPKIGRYWRSMALAGSLCMALMAEWVLLGRPMADLGLAIPVPKAGIIGIGIAVALFASLLALVRIKPPRGNASAEALLPSTPDEKRVFIALSLVIGTAWEILYRGYLLWMLIPLVGTVGAVAVAAAAYGMAHGFKGWKPFLGSLLSAVIFTTAYALTDSLWWLILIHVGLPLSVTFARPSRVPEVAKQSE